MRKIAVIGLDCAAPSLLFDRYRSELPELARLMREGEYARLRSCDPPITVPAWASLFSGRDPGELGIYGFRNRRSAGYEKLRITAADAITETTLWDVVEEEGGDVILLGIPPSYPARPLRGCRVGCLLTPTGTSQATWPRSLAAEIETIAPGYAYDVSDFRGADPDALLARLRRKTSDQFRVARHLLRSRPWDLFAMVEMGPDRLQHALWRFIDPEHPEYRPGTRMETEVLDYFRLLDRLVGELLDVIGGDALVAVVSDHGAQPMRGGVCVNDWLRREGYLVLHAEPAPGEALRPEAVDWGRTVAWAEGGYYARIFLNRRDREPLGWVEPESASALLATIAAGLAELSDRDGSPIGARAFEPSDIYRVTRGLPPDLMVYFGELGWRSIGSMGHASLTVDGNDTGADDANHAHEGVFVLRDPSRGPSGGAAEEISILDVATTLSQRAGRGARGRLPGRPFGACAVRPSSVPGVG